MFQIQAKSHHKLTISLFRGGEGAVEAGGPYLYILDSIIIGKHMKMFCFKFQQNRTINKEFDCLKEGGGQGKPHLYILIPCYPKPSIYHEFAGFWYFILGTIFCILFLYPIYDRRLCIYQCR